MSDLISRRGIFIISYQLDGICNALRLIAQTGAKPGEATVAVLRKLQDEFAALVATGHVIERIPQVTSSMSSAEVLCIAEVLRSSALAFLTPDEAEERKRSFGFSTS